MNSIAREHEVQRSKPGQGSPVTTIKQRSRVTAYVSKMTSALLTLLLLPMTASAQVTTDRFACTLGEDQRNVNVTYLDRTGFVPCEIREVQGNDDYRVLWRADNDAAFCQRQFGNFYLKLQSLGWQCDAIDSPDTTLAPQAAAPADILEPEPQVSLTNPGATAAPQQVLLFGQADSPAAALQTPSPPSGKYGNLSADDIREMDDWLIYLSALTMDSIRRLVTDTEQFESYLLSEQLDATNIYERLQNRIELLNRLQAGRTGNTQNITSADF